MKYGKEFQYSYLKKMKFPKTFVPEKNLEVRTEELLEEKEIKPKIDPKITLIDQVLDEIENNPKYYDSGTFHSNVYALLNQKGYDMVGGAFSTYSFSIPAFFFKMDDTNHTSVLIRTFEKKNYHYCFARTDSKNLQDLIFKFDSYKKNKNSLIQNCNITEWINTFYPAYISGLGAFVGYELITKAFRIPQNTYYSFGLLIAGICSGLTITYLKRKKGFKKSEENLKLLCKELILDEREAIRRALK